MTQCIYCDRSPTVDNPLTLEHIWPQALGGDFLPDIFQSQSVCMKCNSICGQFVDGAFIKSWNVAAERSTGAQEFLDPDPQSRAVLPLSYIGAAQDLPHAQGELIDIWLGACGAHILHFRPDDRSDVWGTYVGGKPGRKSAKQDRVYVTFTSAEPFWIGVVVRSVQAHFRHAKLIITNAGFSEGALGRCRMPSPHDAQQVSDMRAVDSFVAAASSDDKVRAQIVLSPHADGRWLSKIALGLGHSLLGESFRSHPYRKTLQAALWTKDIKERASLPVKGSGYFSQAADLSFLARPAAWVLVVRVADNELSFFAVTPMGRSLHVLICDDPQLVSAYRARQGP